MQLMSFFFRWGWVLGVALLVPVGLPAGGAFDRSKHEVRRIDSTFNPLFAGENCFMRASPFMNAPVLRQLRLGTPMRIVRFWTNEKGKTWLQIQISSSVDDPYLVSRGWINV